MARAVADDDTGHWPDRDMLGAAWGIIANAGGGNWLLESEEWRDAATRWRDAYHRILDTEQAAPTTGG